MISFYSAFRNQGRFCAEILELIRFQYFIFLRGKKKMLGNFLVIRTFK